MNQQITATPRVHQVRPIRVQFDDADEIQALKDVLKLVVANHAPEELALGYLRYEVVRRMNPQMFGELYRQNLNGELFDDLVDDALKTWKWPL